LRIQNHSGFRAALRAESAKLTRVSRPSRSPRKMLGGFVIAARMLDKPRVRRFACESQRGKQNFMQGIKGKVVVITGASSESIRERAAE
jgi:hypothetical protein